VCPEGPSAIQPADVSADEDLVTTPRAFAVGSGIRRVDVRPLRALDRPVARLPFSDVVAGRMP
jgi:hypothetical protein